MDKIIRKEYFLYFLLIPFFKPICLQYISGFIFLDKIYNFWKIISAITIIIIFYMYVLKTMIIPKSILAILAFEVIILVSTIVNHGYLQRALIDMTTVTSISMCVYIALRRNIRSFFSSLNKILLTLMLINLFLMIIFPSGINANLYTNINNPLYFMTTDNGTGLFILTVMLVNTLYNTKYSERGSSIVITLCLITVFISKSSTSIVICLLYVVYYNFFYRRNYNKVFNPILLTLIYILIFIMILTGTTEIFKPFIEVILKKSVSFTGRDILWKQAIDLIKDKFILGYGRSMIDYISIWGGRFSSHNFILELLLQGGLISLISFLNINWNVVKNLNKVKFSNITNLLTITLFLIYLGLLMEISIHHVYLYIVLMLAYETPFINNKFWDERRKNERIN